MLKQQKPLWGAKPVATIHVMGVLAVLADVKMVVVVVELYATKAVPLVVQEVVQETVVTARNIL